MRVPLVHRGLDWSPPSAAMLLAGGAILLLILYATAMMVALDETPLAALRDALVNVSTLAVLAVIVHAFLKSTVMPRSVGVQIIAHAGLSVFFVVTWYALIIVLFALSSGLAGQGFAVRVWPGPVFIWQVVQGLTLYATIAAVCYAIRGGREAASVTIVSAPPFERYFTRIGDDIIPIYVRDIVSITGAQDYAEVMTAGGQRHLVRMSLAEFETRLDPHRFSRVHRSTIVNLDHLTSAEPAGGGRLLVHLTNGNVVQTSRTGAQTLRAQIV